VSDCERWARLAGEELHKGDLRLKDQRPARVASFGSSHASNGEQCSLLRPRADAGAPIAWTVGVSVSECQGGGRVEVRYGVRIKTIL
jgi:hypothetical protein